MAGQALAVSPPGSPALPWTVAVLRAWMPGFSSSLKGGSSPPLPYRASPWVGLKQ